ncbi:hypothetical protein Tco_1457070 [Tanacetum coccineum]
MVGLLFNKFKEDRVRVKGTWQGSALSLRGLGTLHGSRKRCCWFWHRKLGQVLDEEQLAFLADPGILNDQAIQTTILQNAAFQTDNLDAYDSDCDDISSVKAVLMPNLSSYGSDVLFEVLSKEDLKGTRIEHGFKRAFMSLFGQDNDTFKSTMLLNVDQLLKQLDKDEFQEDGSMAAFWVINTQFQQFIDSQFTLDYDSQMTDKRVNIRQMQKQESKVDLGKELDASMVVMESSRTKSGKHDTSSTSGNDADAENADIKPVYDEEPLVEVQLIVECNVTATGQQHTKQPKIINEGRVDQNTEQCQVKSHMLDSSIDNKTTEYSNQSLKSENICLKKTVAQF